MATFSQHHVDGLDLALTPLQAMMRIFPGVKDEPLRCHPSPRCPILVHSLHCALLLCCLLVYAASL